MTTGNSAAWESLDEPDNTFEMVQEVNAGAPSIKVFGVGVAAPAVSAYKDSSGVGSTGLHMTAPFSAGRYRIPIGRTCRGWAPARTPTWAGRLRKRAGPRSRRPARALTWYS